MEEEIVLRCPNPKCKMVLEIKDINKVEDNYQCNYCGAIFPNPFK